MAASSIHCILIMSREHLDEERKAFKKKLYLKNIFEKQMIPARGPQTVIEQSYIEHILVILITHKIGSF